jgi:sugar lactone lactonase YvrE
MNLEIAVKSNNILGEGPVWSSQENALYWIDIQQKQLLRWKDSETEVDIWDMPSEIGSFALRDAGGFVVALRDGLAFFDKDRREINYICRLESDISEIRFNDGKCDRIGRFWVGTMDEEVLNRRASLYCLDKSLNCNKVKESIGISNGLGWSPDNKIFYYTDSADHTIYAFDFDMDSGNISSERIFVKTNNSYTPDGLTVDSEGYVWSAMWDGWKIVRYAPDGQVDTEIRLPVQRPTSCTFGGENLDFLYITSARIDLKEIDMLEQPFAGNIFRLNTTVQGLPEPSFLG